MKSERKTTVNTSPSTLSTNNNNDESSSSVWEPMTSNEIEEWFNSQDIKYSNEVIMSKLDATSSRLIQKCIRASTKRYKLPTGTEKALNSVDGFYNCALHKHVNNPTLLSVICTKEIKKGDCIGIYAGTIFTAKDFEKEVEKKNYTPMDQLYLFDIAAQNLSGYNGNNLVISAIENSNATRYIRDASWCADVSRENNVEASLIYSLKKKIITIGFIATIDIHVGQEVLLSWGEDCWRQLSILQLSSQCLISHRLHRYCCLLEKQVKSISDLSSNELSISQQSNDSSTTKYVFDPIKQEYVSNSEIEEIETKLMSSKLLSPKNKRKRETADDEVPSSKKIKSTIIETVSDSDGYKPVSAESALSSLKVNLVRTMAYSLSETIVSQLNHAKHEPSIEQVVNRFSGRDQDWQQAIIAGFVPKCQVTEVLTLTHPARFFSPPSRKAYVLRAKEKIHYLEPIGVYSGIVWVDNSGPDDSQIFSYRVDNIKDYKGPPLMVQCLIRGNEMRFIGDCFEREAAQNEVNAVATIAWKTIQGNFIPCIVFKALRDIEKEEEIVADFGPHYWRAIVRNAQPEHEQYYAKVQKKLKRLEQILIDHQIPLPEKPASDEETVMNSLFESDISYDDL
jgi:hypothetical protein